MISGRDPFTASQNPSVNLHADILSARAEAAGLVAPQAMIDGIPQNPTLAKPYILGALAAIKRKATPAEQGGSGPINADVREPYSRALAVEMVDLPRLALPVVDHIETQRPDLVIAADRGGRYLGLAVFSSWRKRYPNRPFPTIDGKIHFGRISRSVPAHETEEVIEQITLRSGLRAEMLQRKAEGSTKPVHVMLLDDWIAMGRTVNMLIQGLTAEGKFTYGKDFTFSLGTMVGETLYGHNHVVGDPYQTPASVWDNDNYLIGVSYAEGRTRPTVSMNDLTRNYRRELQNHLTRAYDTTALPPSPTLPPSPLPEKYAAPPSSAAISSLAAIALQSTIRDYLSRNAPKQSNPRYYFDQ